METTAFSHLLPIRRLLSFSSAGCKGLPPPFRRDLHAVKRLKGRLDQVGCGVRTALSCSTGKERSSRFFADTRGIITHEGGEGGRGDKKTSKSHRDHDTADTRGVSEDEREKGRRKRSSVAGQNTWGRKRRGEKENYLVHCCFAKAFLLFVSLGECRKGKRRRMDERRRRMVE